MGPVYVRLLLLCMLTALEREYLGSTVRSKDYVFALKKARRLDVGTMRKRFEI
jgi:hypothetical protein